jgi:hypothetical protein
MGTRKSEPPDLVSACKSLPRAKVGWKATATPEQMEQMTRMREAYHRGEIVASIRHIHETITAVLGLRLGRNALTEWLHEGRPNRAVVGRESTR